MSGLRTLRVFALLEGISLLILVTIAMPLKYAFGLPIAVRIAGGAHGLLFLLFASTLYRVANEQRWAGRRSLYALGCALVPGGMFVLDVELKRDLARAVSLAPEVRAE